MKKTEQRTVLDEVRELMRQLQEDKAAQLETIRQKQEETRSRIEAAGLAMRQATEEMDAEAYDKAKTEREKANDALAMYTGRFEQITAQEYISEADSDNAIESLLAYEDQLAEDFKAAAAGHLAALAELLNTYREAVTATEWTLTEWQRDIHANYNTRGGTAYYDAITGQHTYRSSNPVPVHAAPYAGCSEAVQLGEYLQKAAPMFEG